MVLVMNYMEMILGLVAGLGFFLYGMKLMSDGLEKVAGAKMQSVLEMCTKNRFIGVIVGFIFTAIIQSSSATTVMIVSFVNSGLMTLTQAVGPIMGANIGTTITGQLVALELDAIAPFFIILGVIMMMFSKKQFIQKIGEVVLGLGILFFGMGYMKEAMSDMKDSQRVVDFIQSVKNPFVLILAGLVITTMLQSSSATIGIMIGMASASLLGNDLVVIFYMMLGINIGTCTSAILASLTGKKEAKRAAMIHFLFNVLGAVVMFPIIALFGEKLESIMYAVSGGRMASAVANINTFVKVFQVLIFFPFAKGIVRLAEMVIPGKDEKEAGFECKFISMAAITPASGIAVINEIKRMGKLASNNLKLSFEALMYGNEEGIQKVLNTEAEIDFLSKEITDYLVRMNHEGMPISTENHIDGYFHVVSDIERIGDHAENLVEFAQTKIQDKIEFSNTGVEQAQEMFDKVVRTVDYALYTFTNQTEEHLQEIVKLENEVDRLEKKLQNAHVKRITENKCSPKSAIYADMVTNLERVSDHATNIAFAIYDQEQYEMEG